ncbi:MAG: murein biosynthesis integral membrane protein MurJ [Acidimicrobiales bacterium]
MSTEATTSTTASPTDIGDRAESAGSLVGDSGKIAVAAALSRITGLLRIVVAASILGATVLGDLFVAINVLPLTLYDVFAGSAISSVLVPPLVRLLQRGDEQAKRFVANALGIICLTMTALAIGAVLGRGFIAAALTAGVEEALRPEAGRVAGLLLLLIIPQLVLYAAIGVFVSVQHAHQRFLLPSAAPIIENLGLLLTIAVAWFSYGSGIEVGDAPTGLVLTLAIGSGLSVSAHAIVQFIGARRALGPLGMAIDWRNPEMLALAGPAKSSFGWSSTIAVRQFALVVAAGFAGAGGVQAFEIAMLAYFIPVALIGRPIASAALPRLAKSTADVGTLLQGYRSTLRLAAWIAVPAGLAMVVLSQPFAEIIGQGRFSDSNAITMLRYGLAGLGLGAMSEALFEITRQTTMAQGDHRGLVRSTWIRAGAALVGIPAVVLLLHGPAVLLGLGVVVTIGDLTALAVAHRSLRADRSSSDSNRVNRSNHWPRIVVASALAITPAAIAGPVLGLTWSPFTAPLLLAAVGALFGASCWLLTDRGRLLKALTADLNGVSNNGVSNDGDSDAAPNSSTTSLSESRP